MTYGAINPASLTGAAQGRWRVTAMQTVRGAALADAAFVDIA